MVGESRRELVLLCNGIARRTILFDPFRIDEPLLLKLIVSLQLQLGRTRLGPVLDFDSYLAAYDRFERALGIRFDGESLNGTQRGGPEVTPHEIGAGVARIAPVTREHDLAVQFDGDADHAQGPSGCRP